MKLVLFCATLAVRQSFSDMNYKAGFACFGRRGI